MYHWCDERSCTVPYLITLWTGIRLGINQARSHDFEGYPVLGHSTKRRSGGVTPEKIWKTCMRFGALYCICCTKIVTFFLFFVLCSFLYFSVFSLFYFFRSGERSPQAHLVAPLVFILLIRQTCKYSGSHCSTLYLRADNNNRWICLHDQRI